MVARWSDELLIPLLPAYLTLRHFLFFFELLEDAWAARGGPSGAVAHAGRMSVEHALLSVLAHQGYTNQNRRWLVAFAHEAIDLRARATVARCARLLFPAAHETRHDEAAYLGEVASLGGEMYHLYRGDAELRRGMEYLRSRIHYVDPEDDSHVAD